MKKWIIYSLFLFPAIVCLLSSSAQEVLKIQSGGIVTIQPGVELTLQGGLTLENGGGLANNGIIRLKNNPVANGSDWRDNSTTGGYMGAGLVIFNSTYQHNYFGFSDFYRVQMNAGGLMLNNNFVVSDWLQLVSGKINTAGYYVFLNNNNTGSLLNDISNTGYSNSWINGNFRRLLATNSNIYDFPVGNAVRSNLLQLENNNLSGTGVLTAWFGAKPGTDAGLNVSENGGVYTAVNNGGVWYLVPDQQPAGGNYSLHLYFNGFTGLTDNQFGMLRRATLSSDAMDWSVPAGSSLVPYNGEGRKLSDGFARRINITDFSQWGIGMLNTIPCGDCTPACTYTHGFYGNVNGKACYTDNAGNSSTVSSAQLMLNAFGAATSKVFGNIANRRFFTLYKTDISSGKIFKMLPGSGNSQVIAIDNVLPYNGASYDDPQTWSLVPIQPNGSQKGRINNLLLSQLMVLWFNLQTSGTLGAIDLSEDTLVTAAQASCGSGQPTGEVLKFGLPHDVVVYLTGGNGYAPTVNGLYQLANDILGGANTDISPAVVQSALSVINNAFDGCRILTETIPYGQAVLVPKNIPGKPPLVLQPAIGKFAVTAFPNPYNEHFNVLISSPVSGMASIDFFSANGAKLYQVQKFVEANTSTPVAYLGPHQQGTMLYRVTLGTYKAGGVVIGIR